MVPSLKKHLFKDYLKEYFTFRATDVPLTFRYNRKMAVDFYKQGLKNNPDFITQSTFGQLFSQCLAKSPDFQMMQNESAAFTDQWVDDYDPGDV